MSNIAPDPDRPIDPDTGLPVEPAPAEHTVPITAEDPDAPNEGEPSDAAAPLDLQPDTQGDLPIEAELGPDGQGDVTDDDL